MAFNLFVDSRALHDIQDAIDYYDSVQVGLGDRFEATLNEYLQTLKTAPYFQTRYSDVHCLPLKTFPYMVHYTIDSAKEMIVVWGVFHTAADPKKWRERS